MHKAGTNLMFRAADGAIHEIVTLTVHMRPFYRADLRSDRSDEKGKGKRNSRARHCALGLIKEIN